jgi:subtilisin-like proprotein convertase family protein
MVSGKTGTLRRGLVFACLAMLLSLQVPVSARLVQDSSKEQDHFRMVELRDAMNQLRGRLQADPTNARIQQKLNVVIAEYEAISARNGGYRLEEPQSAEPDRGTGGGGPTPPANCVPINTSTANTTPAPIPDNNPTGVTSTITVAGAGAYLWDVNVITNITHTWNSDLDITITSPAGTVVSLSTDNGGSNDNVFNGTTWDDDAGTTNPPGAITDTTFANNVVETPLVPEEALGAFIGENPNGTWSLFVVDQANGDTGTINSWSLDITSFATPPMNTTTSASNMTPAPIPDNNPAGVTSTITVAGAGTSLCDVNVITNITHTWNSDLQVTLTSPAGTVVTLTTGNGGSNDNVFNGTTWDDDAGTTNPPGAITDTTFANNVVETPLVPEEALGAFIGENPNGTWSLLAVDTANGDTGTINSWSLDIVTCTCMTPTEECMIFCPADVNAPATDPTGAVVTYPAPTTTGDCGPVTCTPASGSFFPVGTTTVTCTAATQQPARGGSPVTMTYSSGAIANPIPDVGMTMQTITVPDMGTVTDVDVRVRINHGWDEDVDISLMGPNGVTIDLSSDNGGSADNYGSGATDCTGTPTVFDDEAGTPITSGTAPFAASFSPEQALTAFDGIDAAGDWKLIVADDEALLTGTLFCYELVITRLVGGGGGGASCSFNVNVAIPFDNVCVDDATCDTFSTTVGVAPSSPLYGYWEYRVAATGEVFSGTANTVNYVPNRSLTMGDNVTPNVSMYAQIDYARRTCTVRVSDRTTGRQFVLRDRNITQPNPNCMLVGQ